MTDASFWIGFVTPFIVLLMSCVCLLTVRVTLDIMRLLNRKVHDRFMRIVEFTEDIDADGDATHDVNANELAKAFAHAPGFRLIMIGPWRIAVCRDYMQERPKHRMNHPTATMKSATEE